MAEINSDEVEDISARSNAMQTRVADTRTTHIERLGSSMAQLFRCQGNVLRGQPLQMDTEFNSALTRINTTISNIINAGGDPAKMVATEGEVINWYEIRDGLLEQRAQAIAQFDEATARIEEEERAAIESLTTGLE